MVYTKDNFYDLISQFTEVGVIQELSFDNFMQAFHSVESSKYKNIVYVWRAEQKVPRLKGNSDILYIGKTDKKLGSRYDKSIIKNKEVKTSNNRLKYEHILTNYGGKIKLSVLSLDNITFDHEGKKDDLLFFEGLLLRWYFLNHCEYPPLNYTKTTVKNDELEIIFKK